MTPGRPIIGIPTQTQEPLAGGLPRCWIMSQRYIRVLTSVGAVPWLIPLLHEDSATLREIYDHLDGLFLTGGVDMDPESYGELRGEGCGPTDPARDQTEVTLVRWAVRDHKPVLAVCRGIQVVNVACGGTLHQDLAADETRIKHDYWPTNDGYPRNLRSHTARVEAGSRLADILGEQPVPVNSMHHQGIKALAPGLRATAFAPDGLIEGVEAENGHFLIGVQWHPEELVERDPAMLRLFQAFVNSSEEYRLGRAG